MSAETSGNNQQPPEIDPRQQETAAAILDLFAKTAGQADIFGPGVNDEVPPNPAPGAEEAERQQG